MTRLEQVLFEVDWDEFERHIIQMTTSIPSAFQALSPAHSTERISQVSIWTDVAARVSAINLETIEHARIANITHAQWLRTHDFNDEADIVSQSSKSLNPAGFLYPRVVECYHPELEVIHDHLASDESIKIADQFISEKLRIIRQEIIETGLLHALPHEDPVWFGVSSDNDWYDHEIAATL